jgi:transposase-like protein
VTIADLAKARAYADAIDWDDDMAADWIRELADEVESQERALRTARASEQAALADATRLAEENAILRTALAELLENVGALVKGLS